MRLLKCFLVALITFVSIVQVNAAGWVPLSEPSATAVSNACSTTSNTTITFTAQGTGTANANRISVVTINWSDSTLASTAQLNTVTIGGISMVRAARAIAGISNSNSEVWYVSNPSGTTANVVATFASAVNGVTIEVYSLIGYVISPVVSGTGTTSISIGYSNKQVALAAGSRTVNVSTSLSNMVNDFSSACGTGLWGVHASQVLKGNNQTLTTNISPTSNNPEIALVIWGVQPTSCVEATNFLQRTVGLDGTHTSAYNTLICGLVADGVWPKLDGMYVFATQDSNTALTNLVSSSYTGIPNGSPTFTVNQGFTGVTSSSTVYIDTQFNPSTASSPKFTLNSAHISCYSVTDSFDDGYCAGVNDTNPSSTLTQLRLRDSSFARAAWGLNGAAVNVIVSGTSQTMDTGNRPDSTHVEGWVGSGQLRNDTVASTNLANRNIYAIALNNSGTAISTGLTTGAITWGGGLTSSDVPNLFNRLHLWMQTFAGVP